MVRFACITIALALLAPLALATDGVLEINQARALAGNVTLGDAPGFPVEIFTRGSFRLTGDLTVPAGIAAGIAVYAPGTRIDLNGFSISSTTQCSGAPLNCTPSGTGVGIDASGASGVEISNGRIAGFGVYGAFLSEGSRAEHLSVESNGLAGIVADRDCVVTDNVVQRNGGPGIQTGAGSRISSNVVSGNKGVGADLGGATGFAQNVFDVNAGGSVSGGRATGGNVCDDGRCSVRGARRFYLTVQQVNGSQALLACGSGFHMAAFWELENLSALEYASALGKSGFDMGKGPPNDPGWARTGVGNNAAGGGLAASGLRLPDPASGQPLSSRIAAPVPPRTSRPG